MTTTTNTPSRFWLVTGATSGFGRSIVEAALAAGDVVIGTARRPLPWMSWSTNTPTNYRHCR